jgi:hypothetical protein
MSVPAPSTTPQPFADAPEMASRDALIDRRAAETTRQLMLAIRRRSFFAASARLSLTGAPGRAHVEEKLAQLDDEIAQLRRALRERPWTEAF